MNLKSFIKSSVLMSMLALTTAAFGQKDILLYSTDFKDWGAVDGSGASSSDVLPCTKGGEGFYLLGKPTLDPTTGTLSFANSTCYIETKSFDFISGAVVEVEFYSSSTNAREITLSETVSQVKLDYTDYVDGAAKITDGYVGNTMMAVSSSNISTTPEDDRNVILPAIRNGEWQSGSKFKNPKVASTTYVVSFNLPSVTGAKTIKVQGMNKDVYIKSLKIYTSVGTTPYVASPSYPNAGADGTKTSVGLALQGAVGGAQVSGNVDVKGFNLTGDVTFSVVGPDAAKFTLGATSMSAADAMAGTNTVAVNFTPSVKAGNANALLKISSSSNDYYVNLIGATGSGDPQIVASTSVLNFWTSLIATTTQTLDVSGLNLTGPITATLTGEGASRFSLSTTEITLADATKGTTLDITFTGDIKAGELPANLVLSSAGAQSVTVPLNGVTSLLRPVMYPLEFDVNPSGTAYVETNPGGTIFKEGTQVTVTVTLEKGYKISRWQDASGNTKSTRLFVVSESKNTMSGDPITVFTEIGQQSEGGDDPVEVSGLVALEASNVTADGLTANWTTQDGNANGYIVTVTDANGNVVATEQAASTSTSVAISGLEENTLYYYTVEGTGTEGTVTTEKVGGFRTLSTVVKECGSDDYND